MVSRWLDQREQRAWRGFLDMHRLLTGRLNRELQRASGMSGSDYAVLVSLSEAPGGRLRGFQLAEAMQWEKSRLSHHLTRMESRGMVVREGCTDDGRGAHVALTEAGAAAIEAAAPCHVADVRRFFLDRLTLEQLDTLTAISETVTARLSELPACSPGSPEATDCTD